MASLEALIDELHRQLRVRIGVEGGMQGGSELHRRLQATARVPKVTLQKSPVTLQESPVTLQKRPTDMRWSWLQEATVAGEEQPHAHARCFDRVAPFEVNRQSDCRKGPGAGGAGVGGEERVCWEEGEDGVIGWLRAAKNKEVAIGEPIDFYAQRLERARGAAGRCRAEIEALIREAQAEAACQRALLQVV